MYLYIARHQTDVIERSFEVTKLLIGQCLDGRRVDGFRHVFPRQRYGVLGNDRLSGRGVRRHEHVVVLLQM